MRVDINKITGAINKISDLASGDKTIPGVMLDLSQDELKVCYSDGRKSLIEKLEVTIEEGDYIGKAVVSFEQIVRAISNCQPSGSIIVNEVVFEYKDNKIITVMADQYFGIKDSEGNITDNKKVAKKKMDLAWSEPESTLKTAILTRMKYETIFEADTTDEFDRKELIDILNRTSVEKGKQVFFSTKTQSIFVSNQAHLTMVPVSPLEVSEEEKQQLKERLQSENMFTEDKYEDELKKLTDRLHFPICIGQSTAKSIIGILGRLTSDIIYVHTSDKYCNFYIDNEDECVGVWIEMTPANKLNLDALERFNSYEYKTYQITFLREFLENNVKSAYNATKNERIAIKFVKNEESVSGLNLIIVSGSASASTMDTYEVQVDSIIDSLNNIETKTFNISLKILSEMLAQIKTEYVAFDISIEVNDLTMVRIAELDRQELAHQYMLARKATEARCIEQGIEFIPEETPTPLDIKTAMRVKQLVCRQMTMLAK